MSWKSCDRRADSELGGRSAVVALHSAISWKGVFVLRLRTTTPFNRSHWPTLRRHRHTMDHEKKEDETVKHEDKVQAIQEGLTSLSCEEEEEITYVNYESEEQMSDIMRLIEKDLSEPYSIYTYRY